MRMKKIISAILASVVAAGICAANVEGEIECSYALSINKSYPDFYIDYNNIGGKANVLDIR